MRWILVAWFLLCSTKITANELFTPYDQYLYRIWSVESGLPQISVLAMVQDAEGFIWLATQGGLARFDGQHFTVFNTANTPTLPSNYITTLLLDSQQQLWIGTANGLVKRSQQQFHAVTGGSIGSVNALAETPDGTIWAGADQLYRFDGASLVPQWHQKSVFSLLAAQDSLWVGSLDGVAQITQQQYQWFASSLVQQGVQVHELAWYAEKLWLGSSQGLYQLQGTGEWRHIALPDDDATTRVEMIATDQQQGLWISTLDALYRWDNGELVEHILLPEQEEFSWVESLLQDQQGNIWLGSRSHGVKRLRRAATERYGVETGLRDPYAWAVQAYNQHLLVGTRHGVDMFDPATGRYKSAIDPSELPNPLVYSFYLDHQQRLWVGTRGGVAVFEYGNLKPLFQLPELANRLLTSFAEQGGKLWLGTNGGLYFVTSTASSEQATDDMPKATAESYLAADFPPETKIRVLITDSQQRLWIGTEVGLFMISANGELSRISDELLGHNFITTVFELPDGNMFVGTFDRGFSIGLPGQWQNFSQQQGLPGNGVIYASVREPYLLVTNFEGIYRLNYQALRQGRVEELYLLIDDRRPESLTDSHRCCNGAGASKGAELAGRLWFPTLNGLVAVNLAHLQDSAEIPKTVITHFTSGLQTILNPQQPLTSALRDLQFSFSAPYFVQAASLEFRYQLQGYDANWVYAANRRDAFYTNLAPGEYIFKVEAKSAADYRWSEPVELKIKLPARWYETWPVMLVGLLSVVAAIWGMFRLRIAALAKAQRRLQRLVAERTEALSQANQLLQQMSMEDALTGLYNRHYLRNHVAQMEGRARRSGNPLVWVLLDLDHFKQINDKYGHQIGDDVLSHVARILQRNSRGTDHVLRWGGEEFLLILEDNRDTALYLHRLQAAFAQENWQALQLSHALTCSVGAVIQHPDLPWQQCMQLADQALYAVKKNGRNGYLLLQHAPNMACNVNVDTTTLAALIRTGQFTYHSDSVTF